MKKHQIIRAVNDIADSIEGFVVVDKDYNRVKVKSEYYLSLHGIRSNGELTAKKILTMIDNESIDDYLASYPEDAPKVEKFEEICREIAEEFNEDLALFSMLKFQSRKEVAEFIASCKHKAMFFQFYDGVIGNGAEYLDRSPSSKFLKVFNEYEKRSEQC